MLNTIKRASLVLGTVALFSAASFAETTPAQPLSRYFDGAAAERSAAQREITALLADVGDLAYTGKVHASYLQTWAGTNTLNGWDTHVDRLSQMKETVNRKAAAIRQLRQLYPQALPWQKVAIDRVEMLQVSLVANLNAALDYTNKNRRPIAFIQKPYRQLVEGLYTQSKEVHSFVSAKLDYAEARANLDQLASN